VVTAAAQDASLAALQRIEVHRLISARTTTFENSYRAGTRHQIVHARAEPLTIDAVPRDFRRARIVHLAPVAQEVDPALAHCFPGSFVGLTPQGWMRAWDAEGRTLRCPWPGAPALLAAVSATVFSLEDVGGDWDLVHRWAEAPSALVVTHGERGATVFFRGQKRTLGAPPVEVVDETGAGDVFAACFFARYCQSGDPWDSARFAVAIASDSVTRRGVAGIPPRP
jgi:hypothetical protein